MEGLKTKRQGATFLFRNPAPEKYGSCPSTASVSHRLELEEAAHLLLVPGPSDVAKNPEGFPASHHQRPLTRVCVK
jgi:hypothetical protein